MEKGPFKLKSGNKPSIAELSGALPMKEPAKKMKPKVGEVTGSYTATFTEKKKKKKKKSKFNFNKTRDFSKSADYSQKAIDYRKYSDLEKHDTDRD